MNFSYVSDASKSGAIASGVFEPLKSIFAALRGNVLTRIADDHDSSSAVPDADLNWVGPAPHAA